MRNTLIRTAFVFAALAVLLRAFVPAGYMPELGAKTYQLVICSLEGNKMITVDAKGVPVTPVHKTSSETPCDFSLVKSAALQAPAAIILMMAMMFVAVTFASAAVLRRKIIRYTLAQSRAPPVSA